MLLPKLLSGINILWLICREGNLPEVCVLERTAPVTLRRQATSQISEMSLSRDKSYRQRVFATHCCGHFLLFQGEPGTLLKGQWVQKMAEEDISKFEGSLF